MNSSPSDPGPCRFGVIIVTHNSEAEIAPCVDSLRTAAAPDDISLTIIDNASSDGTARCLASLRAGVPGFRAFSIVENRTNAGFTKAVNQGLRATDAEMVLFLNPDTVLTTGCLDALAARLRDGSATGVIAPQCRYRDGRIQHSCRRFPRHRDVYFVGLGLAALFPRHPVLNSWRMGGFNHMAERFVDQPQGAFLLARREVVDRVGLWDEEFPMFFSDVDWCRRVHAAGFQILFTPEPHVIHHKGRSIRPNRAAMILSSHRSFARYFWKYCRGWRWLIPNLLTTGFLAVSGLGRYLVASLKLKTQPQPLPAKELS